MLADDVRAAAAAHLAEPRRIREQRQRALGELAFVEARRARRRRRELRTSSSGPPDGVTSDRHARCERLGDDDAEALLERGQDEESARRRIASATDATVPAASTPAGKRPDGGRSDQA